VTTRDRLKEVTRNGRHTDIRCPGHRRCTGGKRASPLFGQRRRGKTTLAVNLAIRGRSWGIKVVAVDAYINGPNVPMMMWATSRSREVIKSIVILTARSAWSEDDSGARLSRGEKPLGDCDGRATRVMPAVSASSSWCELEYSSSICRRAQWM